jgi:RNA polymerase-binding transcription factor
MSKRNDSSKNDSFRELLLGKREDLNRKIEQRRNEIVMEQETKDEAGVALRNSSMRMAIVNNEWELRTLAEIDLSLRRIEKGEYGVCSLCGEKIPLVRLKAIPWTRSCVDCAGGGVVRKDQGPKVAA